MLTGSADAFSRFILQTSIVIVIVFLDQLKFFNNCNIPTSEYCRYESTARRSLLEPLDMSGGERWDKGKGKRTRNKYKGPKHDPLLLFSLNGGKKMNEKTKKLNKKKIDFFWFVFFLLWNHSSNNGPIP